MNQYKITATFTFNSSGDSPEEALDHIVEYFNLTDADEIEVMEVQEK